MHDCLFAGCCNPSPLSPSLRKAGTARLARPPCLPDYARLPSSLALRLPQIKSVRSKATTLSLSNSPTVTGGKASGWHRTMF